MAGDKPREELIKDVKVEAPKLNVADKIKAKLKKFSAKIIDLIKNVPTNKICSGPKSRKLVLAISASVLLIVGGGSAYYFYKDKIKFTSSTEDTEGLNYKIYTSEEVRGNPFKEGDMVYILYNTPKGEEFLVRMKYSNYFLECRIYKFITPEGEITNVIVANDTREKTDLKNNEIVDIKGAKIVYMKTSKPTNIPYFPQLNKS